MSVTQVYNLIAVAQELMTLRQRLYNERTFARLALDWKADEEITCAINNISSAIVALGCAR
jgi:hypothetical protein